MSTPDRPLLIARPSTKGSIHTTNMKYLKTRTQILSSLKEQSAPCHPGLIPYLLDPSISLSNPQTMAFLAPCAVPTRSARSTALSPRRRTTRPRRAPLRAAPVARVGVKREGDHIRGKVFVVRDNIDTDQIIPAEYLTLVPSDPDEYRKLGSYALVGLPADQYRTPYVKPGEFETEYPIVIAGDNFGCGSSREHAPVALGACGGCAVVAQSYARIFFRNCSATGELYPWESQERLVDEFETGDVGVIDFKERVVRNERTGREYKLNDLGDVQPVIDAGGIFEFARQSGMISKKN